MSTTDVNSEILRDEVCRETVWVVRPARRPRPASTSSQRDADCDVNGPSSSAANMVSEQVGTDLPT